MLRLKNAQLSGVFSLARGTVLAQLVFIFATPLLTRIYSPEYLGVFGVYVASVLVISRFAGLSYDLALPLPRYDRVAIYLVVLSSLLSVLTLTFAYIVYRLLVDGLHAAIDEHPLQRHVFLLVAGAILFVIHGALIFWFIRKKSFSTVATAHVINAVTLAMLQLAGFFFDAKLTVIIAAYPIAMLISCTFLISRVDRRLLAYSRGRMRLLRTLAWRYRRFALFSTWGSATYELSQAIPLYVLSVFFSNVQVGYFFIARRVALIPISVIGRAITQVNHADMRDHQRAGVLADVLVRQIHGLQWLCVVPATFLALAAPTLCEFLLGSEWEVAGKYLQLMTPYVVVRFFFAPMGALNYVTEWQKLESFIELSTSVFNIAVLIILSVTSTAYLAIAGYFYAMFLVNLMYRSYLMYRIGVNVLYLLKPSLLQLGILLPILAFTQIIGT